MVKGFLKATALTAGLAFAGSAQAATVTSSTYNQSAWNTFLSTTTGVVENFESFAEDEYLNEDGGLLTSIGTFKRDGGNDGGGGTVTGADAQLFGNTGEGVAVRDGNVFGRSNSTPGGSKFFDSNDLERVMLDVWLGGTAFTSLMFTLVDAADVRAAFSIFVDGALVADYTLGPDPAIPDGLRQIINIDFGGAVTSASILFTSIPEDDGFGIDDVVVSAVPLPAPALMLLGGLAGLAAFRRKRATA
jgi:hypothetical protein